MDRGFSIERLLHSRNVINAIAFFQDDEVRQACDYIERHDTELRRVQATSIRDALDLQAKGHAFPDLIRVRSAYALLNQTHESMAFDRLRQLCLVNGIWTVPKDPETYSPVFFEIQLFGVFASAENAKKLPASWCQVARRVLDAHNCEGAA